MSGKSNLFSKAFGLVVDCDKMIGVQFEKGLAQMKALVEAAEPKRARTAQGQITPASV
jgi:hypothetical protein